MTQMFTPDGLCVPVTVIGVREGNFITMVKTESSDGYNAVQVAYDAVRDDKISKPELGHLKKAGVGAMRHLEEFRLASVPTAYEVGAKLAPTALFKEGDKVDVRGATIGKGFQGAVKRYGFARGLMSHGSKSHRQHGSIGAGTTPGRIYPGKRMHGHMGNDLTTVKGLTVMRVEDDCIIVKGNVPGKKGSLCKVAPAKVVGKSDSGASRANKAA
jgi:large subunit ribosomal protein L3